MNSNPAVRSNVAPESGHVVEDEWGIFDPRRAGVPAVLHGVREEGPTVATVTRDTQGTPTPFDGARPTHCAFCSEPLSPTSRYCSRCLRQVVGAATDAPEAPAAAVAPAPVKSPGAGGALYTLESPARCPQCEKEIRTFRVLRVLRTQVSFTSTLPRKGYVIVCPECAMVLSAELSGLI